MTKYSLPEVKKDLYLVLDRVSRKEIRGLLQAMTAGRVNGSVYAGECACLIGTIANVRGEPIKERHDENGGRTLDSFNSDFVASPFIQSLNPNMDRPIEEFFVHIGQGYTPDNDPYSALAYEWIKAYEKKRFPRKEARK